MNNQHPDALSVSLGGKERYIKLGPAAFRIARKRNVLNVDMTKGEDIDLDTLAHLVFIGLLPDEPDLDEISVMQWLANADEGAIIGNVMAQLTKVTQVMAALVGATDDDEETKKKPRKSPKTVNPATSSTTPF